jgi:hypothetical protein
MSQLIKLYDGTAAPDIETITPDTGGAVGGLNVNLLTGDGITTTGNPGTSTITITLDGYTRGTGQTIGAVTADLITLPLGAVATTYLIEAKIAGFESTTPTGCGYNLICGARTTGAASVILGTQDKYVAEGTGLAACDASFVAVGNTVIVRVTGAAALTINWAATTIQVSV